LPDFAGRPRAVLKIAVDRRDLTATLRQTYWLSFIALIGALA